MIAYKDIVQGIATAIAGAFGSDAMVSDDPYNHLQGPAFIVKGAGSMHDRFSKEHARRTYNFDVVYFAPPEQPVHEMDAVGQQLADAFIQPVQFAGRWIQPENITTAKVDKDFHVTFDLEFYDVIDQPEYDYGKDLEINFRLELTIKGA